MTRAKATIVQHGDVYVAQVEGDIDFTDTERLGAELADGTPNDARGLVLDVSNVRYIDSAGVRMLFELASRLTVCRQRLALALPESSPIRRLIKITKLDEVVLICASEPECIDGIREEPRPSR